VSRREGARSAICDRQKARGGDALGAKVTWRCHRCGRELERPERVGRRDTCLHCGADLHCCRNCRFYESGAHNQCREPQAERQVEKERGNFCEYFSVREAREQTDEQAGPAAARAKLDALFRRGSG